MAYYGGSKSCKLCHPLIHAVYFTPLYLQNVRNFGIIQSAALLLPLVLSQVVTTMISGYVIKWTGRARSSFLVGFLVWTAGQGAQISFGQTTTVGVIVGCLLIQGLGIGATLQSSELFQPTGREVLADFSALVLAQISGMTEDRAAITGVRK